MKYIGLIISFVLLFLAPQNYNTAYCVLCAISYLYAYVLSVVAENKTGNILSFNTFFYGVLFICTFFVPLFVFNDYSVPLYNTYVCRATAIVSIAANVYYIGWRRKIDVSDKSVNLSHTFVISQKITRTLNAICIIVTIIYIIFFRQFIAFSDVMQNDLEQNIIITIIKVVFLLSLVTSVFSKKRLSNSFITFFKDNIISLTCYSIVIITSLFFIGDRTLPAYLLIITIVLYHIYIHKIKILKLLVAALLMLTVFYTVGQTRKSVELSFRNSSITDIIETTSTTVASNNSVFDVFSDYYAATQALYLAEQWKQLNDGDLFFPLRLIPILVNPIPYLPTFFSELIYGRSYVDISSAVLLTNQYSTYVRNINGGFGTHCVADIYISWGILGVLLFFYLFGWLIAYLQNKSTNSIYALVAYFTFLANVLYIPRATIFGPYRSIIFEFFILLTLSVILKSPVYNEYIDKYAED